MDMTEFDAVVAQLRLAIQPIVTRHHEDGERLTWRLLHDIESEAASVLQNAGGFNPLYLHLVRPSINSRYPQTDEPVDLAHIDAIACSQAMIYEAYGRVH